MLDASPISFSTAGLNIQVFLGFQANYVEFDLGTTNGTNEDGVYWSWGMGRPTGASTVAWQRAVSIAAKDATSPSDKTRQYTDRILVARRKVSGVMTTILEVELAGVDSNSLYFNVHTAHSTLSPVMKVY